MWCLIYLYLYFIDAKAAIILQLLPQFIPPKKVVVSGKNSYKASIGASKDSMKEHANVS